MTSLSDTMDAFELKLVRAMNEIVLLELGDEWRDTLNVEHSGRSYITDMEPHGLLRQQILEVMTLSRQVFNGLDLTTFLQASDEEARAARVAFSNELLEMAELVGASIANNAIGDEVVSLPVKSYLRMKVLLAFLMHLHLTRLNDHLLGLYLPTVGSFLTDSDAYANAQSSMRVLLVICAGYQGGLMNELARNPQGVKSWGERFGLSGVGFVPAAPAAAAPAAAPAAGIALSVTLVALILGVIIVIAVAILYDRADSRYQMRVAEECEKAIRQRLPGYEVCLQGAAPPSAGGPAGILGRGIGDPINGLGAGLGKAGEWIGIAISAVLIASFAIPAVAKTLSDRNTRRKSNRRRSRAPDGVDRALADVRGRTKKTTPPKRVAKRTAYDDDDDDDDYEWDSEF